MTKTTRANERFKHYSHRCRQFKASKYHLLLSKKKNLFLLLPLPFFWKKFADYNAVRKRLCLFPSATVYLAASASVLRPGCNRERASRDALNTARQARQLAIIARNSRFRERNRGVAPRRFLLLAEGQRDGLCPTPTISPETALFFPSFFFFTPVLFSINRACYLALLAENYPSPRLLSRGVTLAIVAPATSIRARVRIYTRQLFNATSNILNESFLTNITITL